MARSMSRSTRNLSNSKILSYEKSGSAGYCPCKYFRVCASSLEVNLAGIFSSASAFSRRGTRLFFRRYVWVSSGTFHSSNCAIRSETSLGSRFAASSMSASSSGIGAESVSGYIRSAPGKTRSKIVVPSSKDLRVSFGTPANASLHRSSMVSRAVLISSSGPQKISCASPSLLPSKPWTLVQAFSPTRSSSISEWTMFGFSMQAITFSRSEKSSANIFPGWAKWDNIP